MFDKYLSEKQKAVKQGDRVNICGWIGTVTDVLHTIDTEWNGYKYVRVDDSESTTITVHFDDPISIGYQYQDGNYSSWEIIEEV